MHHPAKHLWQEPATSLRTCCLCRNGTFQSELRASREQGPVHVSLRQADVGVQVPGCDAQRKELIQLVFGKVCRCAKHDTHQLVAAACRLIKQRRWMPRVKACLSSNKVLHTGKMVDILGYIGSKNLVAIL